MTPITLAVVTRNRFERTVETFLQLDLTRFAEVILVDDSDDDRLEKWCSSQPISYLRGPGTNRQAARNVAIGACETEILSFVDDDVVLPTDFADRVAAVFKAHPGAIAAGGPCLSPTVSRARSLCYKGEVFVSDRTGAVYDDSYRWTPDEPQEVGLLKGANMSFRRTALSAVGGFDEAYGGPAQREDTDICVRVRRYGRIIYTSELACLHKQDGSEGYSTTDLYWRFLNHGYFVRKNFGSWRAAASVLSLPFRVCGNPDSLVQLGYRRFAMRQPVHLRSCLRAYLEGVRRAKEQHRSTNRR